MIFFLLCFNLLALINLLQDTAAFDDLGKLLLGGVAAAIVCAVAFTFVRFRLRDKKPPTSSFISISSAKDDD
jgi:UDP-N-acetylmuramyl pentapeptide phosphotransferase/UDP-N-acetylglucosamine-1-phosphate transferase